MSNHRPELRGWRAVSLTIVLALCLTLVGGALTASAQTAVVSPEVTHTGTGPTGYTVTFRYYDPAATNVRIKGEWYFSDAAAANPSPATSAGRLPTQWLVGDFPIAYPNATAANWPVNDMVKDEATGVWSFTTPLPSGVFTYAFYKNCPNPLPSTSGCSGFADPSNLPWNAPAVAPGSTEPTSQVFVPSDPAFGTIDYSWQFPIAAHGTLAAVVYPTPLSTNPVGSHALVVYTPPNYNPTRVPAYPTLYLSHGGGGNEVDWSTQGVAGKIIDNLIAAGTIQPMVVVMTNYNSISGGTTGYATEVVQNVIPYVEANYNVSHLANDRAFSGLSAGGQRTNAILFNYPAAFGAYDVMSTAGGVPANGDPLWANPALKNRLGLVISAGLDDPILSRSTDEINLLTTNNVPFTTKFIDGGHEWYVWRILLKDFVETLAFRHTTTTLGESGLVNGPSTRFVSVVVKASTTEPTKPTGSVQFYLDNRLIETRPLPASGAIRLNIYRLLSVGQHTVKVVYSGDQYYNTSASELVVSR